MECTTTERMKAQALLLKGPPPYEVYHHRKRMKAEPCCSKAHHQRPTRPKPVCTCGGDVGGTPRAGERGACAPPVPGPAPQRLGRAKSATSKAHARSRGAWCVILYTSYFILYTFTGRVVLVDARCMWLCMYAYKFRHMCLYVHETILCGCYVQLYACTCMGIRMQCTF